MLKVYQPLVWLPCRMHMSWLVDSFFRFCFVFCGFVLVKVGNRSR